MWFSYQAFSVALSARLQHSAPSQYLAGLVLFCCCSTIDFRIFHPARVHGGCSWHGTIGTLYREGEVQYRHEVLELIDLCWCYLVYQEQLLKRGSISIHHVILAGRLYGESCERIFGGRKLGDFAEETVSWNWSSCEGTQRLDIPLQYDGSFILTHPQFGRSSRCTSSHASAIAPAVSTEEIFSHTP